MAGKDLTYKIDVDSSKGISGVKSFSSAVKKELKSIEGDFDATATSGQKVATVLSKMAGELDTELDRAAQAADALRAALGEDLASKADVGAIVGDLQKMGLTFEDIVADADKLAAALKELDHVQTKGLDAGLGSVNTKMGTLERSAGSSRSVMANMVGNATQDLGALTGVAGSAGVAIGQMGEYMADALGEGEKLGTVVSNFAAVAGPVAAISAGLFVMEGVMKSISESKALEAERVKTYHDAVEGSVDSATALADKLLEIGKIEFKDPTKGLFGGAGDLLPILASLGISVNEFTNLISSGEVPVDAFIENLWEMREAGEISTDTYVQMKHGLEQYQNTADDARKIQKQLNESFVVTQDLAKGAFLNWKLATDPALFYGDQLLRIGEKVAEIDWKPGDHFEKFPPEILKDLEVVAEALGVELPEVLDLAEGAWNDHQDAMEAAVQATNDALDANKQVAFAAKQAWIDSKKAAKDAALQVAGVEGELRDLAGTFEQIGVKADAIQSIFDLKNAPLDAEAQVRDIELAIRDLSTAAEGIDLSEGLDPANVKADALLDAIDGLRPQIQQKVTDAFSVGGAGAARKVAQDYIAQVAKELDISKVDAAELLGMDHINALIHVAVEQKSLANAQAQLDLLTGLTGETALTATIQLALDAGTITPRQARILIQDQLGAEGVDIPAPLVAEVKPGGLEKAQAALQAGADANPIEQDLVAQPTGFKEAHALAQDYMDRNPINLTFSYSGLDSRLNDALAAAGFGAGTHAAPAELTAGPMAMTTAGVIPMSAGPTPFTFRLAAPTAQPIIINQTFNAAVMGAPHDIANAVEDANRRITRLLPVRQ